MRRLCISSFRPRLQRAIYADKAYNLFRRSGRGVGRLAPGIVRVADPKTPLILYVEDDDSTAYLVQKAFAAFEIVRVRSGDHAIDFLKRSGGYKDAPKPALVLLDLYMPKKDGFEVLAEIRAITSFALLPVVIFSTSRRPEDRSKAIALGANHFFHKPSDMSSFSKLATTFGHLLRLR
jgi:CheY-like chemotaxis protein